MGQPGNSWSWEWCLVVFSARQRCSTSAGVAPEGSESAGDSRRGGKSPGQGVQLVRGRGTRGRRITTRILRHSAISPDRRRGGCWDMESSGTGPVPEASSGPEVIREDLGSRRASESVLVHSCAFALVASLAEFLGLRPAAPNSVDTLGQLFRPAAPKRTSSEKSSWISAAQATSLLPLHRRACPPEVRVQAGRGRVLGGSEPGCLGAVGLSGLVQGSPDKPG